MDLLLCSLVIFSDNCQFTSGVCHWIRDTSVGYYWQRHQGGTMTGGTGPDADHTTGSG